MTELSEFVHSLADPLWALEGVAQSLAGSVVERPAKTTVEKKRGTTEMDAVKLIVERFKEQRNCQVPDHNRFGFDRETARCVIVSRETDTTATIPFGKIERAVKAVRADPSVYDRGPGALRQHGISFINSPLWSLLHLATRGELLE